MIFLDNLYKKLIKKLIKDTFILEVELSEEHEHFISKFIKPDFSNYFYVINAIHLFVSNKNKMYDIKSFKY